MGPVEGISSGRGTRTVDGTAFLGVVPRSPVSLTECEPSMDISTAVIEQGHADRLVPPSDTRTVNGIYHAAPKPPDVEVLRQVGWEIAEGHFGDHYAPNSHVGLAMVDPRVGFAYWRMRLDWVERIRKERGPTAWDGSRPVLRLYDVTFIDFTGFNAHRIQDEHLPELVGKRFFHLPGPGTWQIAEIGFVLRSGEFIPAARSQAIPFGPESPSRSGSAAGLLVTRTLDGEMKTEPIENVWDQDRELRERRRPRLRQPLHIAAFTLASRISGQTGSVADFVTELAVGQHAQGHEVHVFVPATRDLSTYRVAEGVHYHPLEGVLDGPVMDRAQTFASAAREALASQAPFDLIHLHEWMSGFGGWTGSKPAVLSLSSLESTRRNGVEPDTLSLEIATAERELARSVRCVLTPDWLRNRAVAELGVPPDRVREFWMEGRMPNEWECALDFGRVKMGFGIGPMDRVILFVGPLEHAAGVDLLVEALPVVLRRASNLKVAFVGTGPMHPALEGRAWELGVSHAVRLLGHVSGSGLTQLLRASEALVLPSRYRIAMDDSVVDLARKAGRPVVTTHGGPAHLVRHEENGLLTYDNPGSMVWALDRLLGDPGHAERMGRNGKRQEGGTMRWSEVVRQYLESCAEWFPELTVSRL
jgi:glycosyltransferase involved in cell wall biosynthesis